MSFLIAASVISTGANMYNSILQGRLKAIESDIQANRRASEIKIAGFDTQNKINALDAQFEQQIAEMEGIFAQAKGNQMMSQMMQGRTDSLASVEEADRQKRIEDIAMTKLNKEAEKSGIKTDRALQQIMGASDISALKTAGKVAKRQGYIDAGLNLLKGVTDLASMGAFDGGKGGDGGDKSSGNKSGGGKSGGGK